MREGRGREGVSAWWYSYVSRVSQLSSDQLSDVNHTHETALHVHNADRPTFIIGTMKALKSRDTTLNTEIGYLRLLDVICMCV